MPNSSFSRLLAYDPGISPAEGGLPGLNVLKSTISSINLFGIVAVVGALCIAGVVWAYGHFSASPGVEAKGKAGVVIAAGCALLLGAANGIIAFFAVVGTRVQ